MRDVFEVGDLLHDLPDLGLIRRSEPRARGDLLDLGVEGLEVGLSAERLESSAHEDSPRRNGRAQFLRRAVREPVVGSWHSGRFEPDHERHERGTVPVRRILMHEASTNETVRVGRGYVSRTRFANDES
jgi:hypothetical protein